MINNVDMNLELFKNFCNQRNEVNKRKAIEKKYGSYKLRYRRPWYDTPDIDAELTWDDIDTHYNPDIF